MPSLVEEKLPIILDNVLIVGPKISQDKVFHKLSSLEKVGGEKSITVISTGEAIGSLRGEIGPQTRIDIYAHGLLGVKDSDFWVDMGPTPFFPERQHHAQESPSYIHMDDLMSYITSIVGEKDVNGLQIHLWSCYGGRGIHSAQYLPLGATLIIHASEKSPVFQDLNNKYIAQGMARNRSEPLKEFMAILAESPNAASIAQKTTEGLFVYQAPLEEAVLLNMDDAKNQIKTRLSHYHQALTTLNSTTVPDIPDIDSLVTSDQLREYTNEAAYLHAAFDMGVDYIQSYIEKSGINPRNFSFHGDYLPHIAGLRMRLHGDAAPLWDYIVENQLDINMCSQAMESTKMPPLHDMAWENRIEDVDFLLSSLKIDVNCQDRWGQTPLFFAAAKGNLVVVKRLLQQNGILVNMPKQGGHTPLSLAVQQNHADVVDALLQAGGDPMMRNSRGETALFIAAEEGHAKILTRLLQHQQGKASINIPNNEGLTPSMIAEKNGHMNVLAELVKYNSENAKTTHCTQECNPIHQNALSVMRMTDNASHVLDVDDGLWDTTEQRHPTTGEPIFIYRVYKNGIEVGSTSFYKHPLLCRSEEGDRHNIIATTGIFTNISIDTHSLEDICQALPPTLFDQVVTSARQGAEHGALRGIAHVVGYTLKSSSVPPKIAESIQQLIHFGGYFLLRWNAYAAQEKNLDWSGAMNAAIKAAQDTGSMFIVSHVMQWMTQSINQLREKAYESGFTRTSYALGLFGRAAQYGVYAHDAMQRGVLDVAASVSAGGLTQYAIEQVGERAIDRAFLSS